MQDQPTWVQQIRDCFEDEGRILLVTLGRYAVAAAVLQTVAATAECTIRMMATHPQYRRLGFGRLLHSQVHLLALTKRCASVIKLAPVNAHHQSDSLSVLLTSHLM